MQTVYTDIIQFRGNHYDFGRYQGELLKDSFILPNRKKQWGKDSHNFIINEEHYKEVIMRFAPKIWEEIHGLADALQLPMVDAIRDFGGYYLQFRRGGCSIFSTEQFMLRNYDNHPHSYEGRILLYEPSDGGYATIGPTMQITGRTDGINEKGLAMGYNFINKRGSDDGFLCNMIGRLILELCADLEEAISFLKEIPHRMSFTYVLLDQSGKSIVVEASPRRIATREANICTNHFETLTEENRYRMDDSKNREKAIKEGQEYVLDYQRAFELMNKPENGVFSKKYGAWAGTLHTASYHPEELLVGFALGGNKRPVMLDFHKWLKGENLNIIKIRGSIESEASFVNMKMLP